MEHLAWAARGWARHGATLRARAWAATSEWQMRQSAIARTRRDCCLVACTATISVSNPESARAQVRMGGHQRLADAPERERAHAPAARAARRRGRGGRHAARALGGLHDAAAGEARWLRRQQRRRRPRRRRQRRRGGRVRPAACPEAPACAPRALPLRGRPRCSMSNQGLATISTCSPCSWHPLYLRSAAAQSSPLSGDCRMKPMHVPQIEAERPGHAGPATATRRCSAPRRATASAPSPCSCRRWRRRALAAGRARLPGTLTLHLPPAAPPTLSAVGSRAARVPAQARQSSGAACHLRTQHLGSNVRLHALPMSACRIVCERGAVRDFEPWAVRHLPGPCAARSTRCARSCLLSLLTVLL